MELSQAQEAFNNLFSGVNELHRTEFLDWICSHFVEPECKNVSNGNNDTATETLNRIADDMRQAVPVDAILASENIHPLGIHDSDVDASHLIHVDAFLYDDDGLDEMYDRGEIDRYYCQSCDGRKVSPLDIVSHSMSRERVASLFSDVLPDLSGRTVVDVGSRLGVVLYGAYLFSEAARVTGIEMNADLCRLQEAAIVKYRMQERVRVLCGDVRSFPSELREADVVILHNVFECFVPEDVQIHCWNFLREAITKTGALVVAIPGLDKMLKHLPIAFHIDSWLAELASYDETQTQHSEVTEIKLYRVI